MIGALVRRRTGKAFAGGSERRWLLTSAFVETALLWVAAMLALGFDVATQSPEARLYPIIGLTGVAMGYRNATIRQLKVADLTTTVLTLTLTGLGADSRAAGGTNMNWSRRIGAMIAIFAGASLGAELLVHVGLYAPLALAGTVILSGTLAFASHLPAGSST